MKRKRGYGAWPVCTHFVLYANGEWIKEYSILLEGKRIESVKRKIATIIELKTNRWALHSSGSRINLHARRLRELVVFYKHRAESKQDHWSNAYGDDNAFQWKLWRHLLQFYAMSATSNAQIKIIRWSMIKSCCTIIAI